MFIGNLTYFPYYNFHQQGWTIPMKEHILSRRRHCTAVIWRKYTQRNSPDVHKIHTDGSHIRNNLIPIPNCSLIFYRLPGGSPARALLATTLPNCIWTLSLSVWYIICRITAFSVCLSTLSRLFICFPSAVCCLSDICWLSRSC